MRRALIFAAFLVLAAASSDKKEDADIKEIRSLVAALIKDEKRTENENIKKYDGKVSQDTQDRELGENANESINNIDEPESESDIEPIIERGLDADGDNSVNVQYADETEQPEETRELADEGIEGATVDDTGTDELERSLEEPSTAEEPSLDVEDRARATYRYYMYGSSPINRKYTDGWKNAIYIPAQIPLRTGRIIQWQFYARKIGKIYLQVWRRYLDQRRPNEYKLVQQKYVNVKSLGLNSVRTYIAVRIGDRIGFYFPKDNIIPFTGWECTSMRTLYKKDPQYLRPGAIHKFSFKQSGWRPCRRYSFGAKLRVTQTQITSPSRCVGNCVPSLGKLDSWRNAMYIPNPDKYIPTNGYIYKWRFYAKKSGVYIFLQVFRKAGAYNRFTLIDQTPYYVTSTGYKNVSASIKVKRFDRIGFSFPSSSLIPFIGSTNCRRSQYTLYVKNPVIKKGDTYSFRLKLASWKACRKYSFGAYIRLSRKKKRDLEVEEQSDTNEEAEKTFISGV